MSALSQKQEEEENHISQQRFGFDRGQRSATAELLRIKDHLIDVEKKVSDTLSASDAFYGCVDG